MVFEYFSHHAVDGADNYQYAVDLVFFPVDVFLEDTEDSLIHVLEILEFIENDYDFASFQEIKKEFEKVIKVSKRDSPVFVESIGDNGSVLI